MTSETRQRLRQAIDAHLREVLKPVGHDGDAQKRRKHRKVVGTHNASGYSNGCRCEVCTEEHRLRQAGHAQARKAARA